MRRPGTPVLALAALAVTAIALATALDSAPPPSARSHAAPASRPAVRTPPPAGTSAAAGGRAMREPERPNTIRPSRGGLDSSCRHMRGTPPGRAEASAVSIAPRAVVARPAARLRTPGFSRRFGHKSSGFPRSRAQMHNGSGTRSYAETCALAGHFADGETRTRTGDTTIFSRAAVSSETGPFAGNYLASGHVYGVRVFPDFAPVSPALRQMAGVVCLFVGGHGDPHGGRAAPHVGCPRRSATRSPFSLCDRRSRP